MGADKLTFLLDPALPGHLTTQTVKELAGWVAGVELIGEFDQLSAPEINAMAAECGLDAVLLRSFRTAAELAEIAPPVYVELAYDTVAAKPLAAQQYKVGIDQANTLPSDAAGWLVELPDEVPAENLAVLEAISKIGPLWLGPGLNPAAAHSLATQLTLAGVCLPSGNEVKPGLRDFDQLEAVFEALEID